MKMVNEQPNSAIEVYEDCHPKAVVALTEAQMVER